MEIKKQLLIKVLTKLKPYRNLAEGILALIESSYVDNQTIDGIIRLINKSMKRVKKARQKVAMQKWLALVQRIKDREEKEKQISDKELDKLLADM